MNHLITYIRQSLQDIYPSEEVKALSMFICCDMLGLKAADIYMGKDMVLSESMQLELENIVSRLRKNEPIQYIRGFAEFCSMRFKVAPGVLIPRPETEELVNRIAEENAGAKCLLDVGTGSGCIAISLAKKLPCAKVEAWDVSEEALAIARENNEALNGRVLFQHRDVLTHDFNQAPLYDIVVSNPPYITNAERETMHSNVLDWEPEVALFVPDNDPLRFYDRIACLGRQILVPDGKLYFEINQAFGREVVQMLENYQYHSVRIVKDIFDNDRIVVANR